MNGKANGGLHWPALAFAGGLMTALSFLGVAIDHD